MVILTLEQQPQPPEQQCHKDNAILSTMTLTFKSQQQRLNHNNAI
jgi:hypothetical protein